MTVHPFAGARPRIDPSAFVAEGARIVGDVLIEERASVWFNAVIRGDSALVRIGARTNVQDNAVLHTDQGMPCRVSEDCTIGHGAIVHGCTVRRGCLIGMGAVVLSGAAIGEESLVAAGAVVREDGEFPSRSLVAGVPARLVRELTEDEVERLIRPGVRNYLMYAEQHARGRTQE